MKKTLVKILLTLLLLTALAACSHTPQSAGAEHHYPLSGKVVALDQKNQTATVDAKAIPNFMDAMTMEYPVKSKADFTKLHVGDNIKATVNVNDAGGYNLSEIQVESAPK